MCWTHPCRRNAIRLSASWRVELVSGLAVGCKAVDCLLWIVQHTHHDPRSYSILAERHNLMPRDGLLDTFYRTFLNITFSHEVSTHSAQVDVVRHNCARTHLCMQTTVSPTTTPFVFVAVGNVGKEVFDLRYPTRLVSSVAQEPHKLVDKEPAVGDGGVGALRDVAIDEPVVGPSSNEEMGIGPPESAKRSGVFSLFPPIEWFGGQWNP